MNVNINTKTAAACLKSFIKEHGGAAQHSEVLELLARICGFDCYRALQAASQASAPCAPAPVQGQIRPTFALRDQGRLLEDPAHVVYRSTAIDWKLHDDPAISYAEVPQEHRGRYDFVVEQYGAQFRVMFKPEGVGATDFEGKPVLDLLLEINEGVPCAHLTNDPADAVLLSAFGTGEGMLVRFEDGVWGAATRDLPPAMTTLVERACDAGESSRAMVCLHDTAATRNAPAHAVRHKEVVARSPIVTSKDARFDGLVVSCSVRSPCPGEHRLMLTLGLEDEKGGESLAGQPGPELAGPASFLSALPDCTTFEARQEFANLAGRFTATLLADGVGLSDAITLVRKMTQGDDATPAAPLLLAEELLAQGHDVRTVYHRLVNYLCTAD